MAAQAPGSVMIESLSHDGRGVARIDGRVIFVSGALPAEEVTFTRIRRRREYDEGEILEVLKASPQRITPRCRWFGICGGCSLQHLAPHAQIKVKQDVLMQNLRRIGRVEPEVISPPLMANNWGYRRRARLGVKFVKNKGRVLVGFRERLKPYITDMSRCEILARPVDRLIEPLARLIESLSIPDQVPQIEVAVADNATALVFRVLAPLSEHDKTRLKAFGYQHDIVVYLQPGGLNSVQALEASAQPLTYRLPDFDVEIEFLPTDFVQVNGPVNQAMVRRVLELLAPESTERVLDLFCGLGNFTLPLARRAGAVVGVEGDPARVAYARRNAERNGLANARFCTADLFGDIGDLPWVEPRYDGILLDPPRAGASQIIKRAKRFAARRIVYVSCHPETLARDAGTLVHTHGYRLVSAGVMDMFPHTAHVESIALFIRDT